MTLRDIVLSTAVITGTFLGGEGYAQFKPPSDKPVQTQIKQKQGPKPTTEAEIKDRLKKLYGSIKSGQEGENITSDTLSEPYEAMAEEIATYGKWAILCSRYYLDKNK